MYAGSEQQLKVSFDRTNFDPEVTYELASGSEYATIEGNVLKAKGYAGEVTVKVIHRAAGAVSEKRSHFLRLGSHGDRKKAGSPVLCWTGLDCHSSTITGPMQSQCLRNCRAYTEIRRSLCSGPDSAPH